MFISATLTSTAYRNVYNGIRKALTYQLYFEALCRVCVMMDLQRVVRTDGRSAHSVPLLGGDL